MKHRRFMRPAAAARSPGDQHVHTLQRALAEQAEELAELRQRLASADARRQSRSQALARLAHDLRAPLQSTLSWMHLLRQAEGDLSKRDLAIERIQHNVEREAQMLDELVALAHDDAAGRRSDDPGRPVRTGTGTGTGTGATAFAMPHGEGPQLSSRERASLRGLRVLYVEDAIDTAELVRLLLSDLGMDVIVSHRFDEALERVRAGRFDVLLTDLYLDGLGNGLDLLRELRRHDAARRVPAVVLSAYGGEEHLRASAAAGFSAHLTKPVDPLAVARALAGAVAHA